MSYLSEVFLGEAGMTASVENIRKGLEACEQEFGKRNCQCDEQELRDLWDVAREFEDESFEKYEVLKACKRVYEKCRGKGKGD